MGRKFSPVHAFRCFLQAGLSRVRHDRRGSQSPITFQRLLRGVCLLHLVVPWALLLTDHLELLALQRGSALFSRHPRVACSTPCLQFFSCWQRPWSVQPNIHGALLRHSPLSGSSFHSSCQNSGSLLSSRHCPCNLVGVWGWGPLCFSSTFTGQGQFALGPSAS